MLQEIGNQLGIDSTIYVQFVLVVVLYFLLTTFYFKPFLALFLSRKEKTEGYKQEAEELRLQVVDKTSSYESRMRDVHVRIKSKLQDARLSANQEVATMLSTVSEDLRLQNQKLQQDLLAEKDSLMKKVELDAVPLAQEIVKKVTVFSKAGV